MGLISRYETYDLLGTGSTGTVYRAHDIVFEREVAVKILNKGSWLDLEFNRTLFRPGSVSPRLLHPNIPTVYEVGETNECSYIVTEFLRGHDLRHSVDKRRPMPLALKLDLMAQVCDGLAHSHNLGLVHGDIKPSNIFVHERQYAKLMDCGIRRAPRRDLSGDGTMLGTLDYVAPEQILTGHTDVRSDLFSTAIVFFEFLVGRHPFQSSFIPRRIASEDPDTLCTFDPLIPRSLEFLLDKALRKDPKKRIPTAQEFSSELKMISQRLCSGLGSLSPGFEQRDAPGTRTTRLQATMASAETAEWPVAGFLRLLQDFDRTLKLGDQAIASDVLKEMRALEALDDRLAAGIKDCEARLNLVNVPGQPAQEPIIGIAQPTLVSEVSGHVTTLVEDEDPVGPAESTGSVGMTTEAPRLVAGTQQAKRSAAETVSPKHTRDSAPLVVPAWLRNLSNRFQFLRPFPVRLMALPKAQKQVLAIAFAVLAIGLVAFLVVRSGTIPKEKPLAQALIQVRRTDLFERPDEVSRRLMNLQQGTNVSVLDSLSSRNQKFVRAQVISGGRNSRPGYLRTADLGAWRSDDPAVAWRLLWMFRPPSDASPGDLQRFLAQLQTFHDQFPQSAQANTADLERQRIARTLSQPTLNEDARISQTGQSANDVNQELKPQERDRELPNLPSGQTPTIVSKVLAVGSPANSAERAADIQNREEANNLLKQVPGLWDDGNLEEIVGLTQRVLALSPNNDQAKMWNAKARKALRKLSAQ